MLAPYALPGCTCTRWHTAKVVKTRVMTVCASSLVLLLWLVAGGGDLPVHRPRMLRRGYALRL
eukprot:7293079-Alexandrium_andersonii.AAC.1